MKNVSPPGLTVFLEKRLVNGDYVGLTSLPVRTNAKFPAVILVHGSGGVLFPPAGAADPKKLISGGERDF